MTVEKDNHSCFHGPLKVSIYHISHTNSGVYMKSFVIDNRNCPDIMTVFFKHFTLYLPTGWKDSKYSVLLTFIAESLVYDMALFTVEHKISELETKPYT